MSAEQTVDFGDLVDELPDAARPVRYIPSHRIGRPEPIAPAALGLLAVVLAALGGGLLFGVLLGAVLT